MTDALRVDEWHDWERMVNGDIGRLQPFKSAEAHQQADLGG
ncbi:hypothetical protein [Streptomyces sp. NPDC006333]